MELRAHMQLLVNLDPFYISEKRGESFTRLFEIAIFEAKVFRKHELLVDLLHVVCLLVFMYHGQTALLPLRALVSHVLAECPKAKDVFIQALANSHLELKNALF